jgi:hypothetical protein
MSDASSTAGPPVGGTAAFTDLHARAGRIGQWVWIERRVFECFGSWAGTTELPAVAAHFGEMSRRHGWHAELFFDRLPELASVDAEGLVSSPGRATDAFFDGLTAIAEPVALGRLVAASRVLLPMLLTGYRAAAASSSAVAEPSLRRWLDIVVRDDVDEWCRGQDLLSEVVDDVAAVHAAGSAQLRLDLLAVATGGLRG